MFTADDHRYMARALELARRGLYTTEPNPRVGCVLVRGGVVVGEGWHQFAGGPHAEVNALRMAGPRAAGATAYVTLEPCSHFGKTPPCADALVEAQVGQVVAAMVDPNPLVSGRGLERLAAAGIGTVSGLLEAEATAINPGFTRRMRTGLPFVRLKMAASLDGRTAMASGESRWITGPEARRDVHLLRARSSAMLTGIGTVLHDDPSLNVRLDDDTREALLGGGEPIQPLRVVLDSRLAMPPEAKMLGLEGRTLILTATDDAVRRDALQQVGAEVVTVPTAGEGLDLRAVMGTLGERGVNEVMVEAGATLGGALLQAGLVDELVLYLAPHLMGDAARGLFRLPGLERMAERIELTITDVRAVGRDWRIIAKIDSTANESG
ncbi:bifunctional diaminohydroxyphosphoribosylaminopyrimidine deaminase/5-amino-6-(5-phosphoribosylamino)uracil reductase RibD [Endothiovibrio diazotrophicus]